MQKKDSAGIANGTINTELFYDSLKIKASRNRFTNWIYKSVVCSTKDSADGNLLSYEYYKGFEKKIIGSITIKRLDVFGPDFTDTSKVTNIWIEKTANKLHSKSNLYVIRKNLWIKEGQRLDPDLLMDNERLLRSLPYLKDVRIILTPRQFNDELVDVLILTKDVFSFGISGGIGNASKGDLGIYDSNILGIGHEIGVNILAHTERTPHVGFETFYSINNFMGNFINISGDYSKTYLRNGFFVSLERDFLRPQSVYAGGLTVLRSLRSDRVNLNDISLTDYPLDFLFLDGWYGRRLNSGSNSKDSRFQVNLSGRVRYTTFYDRPSPDINNKQYFANSTLYLSSLSFSHRSYVRDYKVYSYGIVEDIPKGYLHELVFGYDHNEFGDRFYSHIYLSTSNLIKNKPYYLFTSMAAGSFFRKNKTEQGLIDFKINFISPLFNLGSVQARQFVKINYAIGINRFEIENLLLRNNDGIRGFGSYIGKGKQRLSLNVENVFFQNKSILNFQSSIFSFFDAGILGPSNQSIFKQNYYAGLGVGIRIRNENLVIKTIQLRLAFYPNHPSDVSSFGFILDGVSRNRFYSFQPRGPEPLRFE